MPKKFIPSIFILCACLLFTQCEKEELLLPENQAEALISDALHPGSMKGKPNGETAGNNLSFPVIWAEGIQKTLPGTFGMDPILMGEWWYWWGTSGTDPNIVPLSCPPDPQDPTRCDDGNPETATGELIPFDNPDIVKAFIQKDQMNLWQAESWPPLGASPSLKVNVDLIDWGDNLESVDWYTRSQVRTEVVLFEDALAGDVEEHSWPMLEYGMRHTDGWGINEVHGLAASLDDPPVPEALDGPMATVYSPCARLTIQKVLVDRDNVLLNDLDWVPGQGWTEPEGSTEDLINDTPLFNMAVHEAQDGPGYYNAEINVKGRIIYGYTWNVRKANEGPGCYRLTFSFDAETITGTLLNTSFDFAEIMYPAEEELIILAAEEGEEPGGGGIAVLRKDLNLTYMDILIHERTGGGGGGGGKPSGGGGGGGGGQGGGRH